jgi:voltage-gated potassium channel
VSIAAIENELLARDAGATIIVNPVSFGGQLLAQCTTGPHVAEYVTDLVTRAGRMEMRERAVRAEEIGISSRDAAGSQIVRIYRDKKVIEVAKAPGERLMAGDWVIELVEAN